MKASDLLPFFDERFSEIETYLDFLDDIQVAARGGPPRILGAKRAITAPQQKILHSSVYLQLYNLVEATVSRCVTAVTDAAALGGRWRPDDLNTSLRGEWVRAMARTHVDMTPPNRLSNAMTMCDHIIERLPISDFQIERGGGGNWDDSAIEKFSGRLGLELKISRETRAAVKRHFRDDAGAMQLVKNRRNELAHGSLSFVECAEGVVVEELRTLADAVGAYLREAIECFTAFIDLYEFLRPDRKPTGTA